jgi:signal peptidase I
MIHRYGYQTLKLSQCGTTFLTGRTRSLGQCRLGGTGRSSPFSSGRTQKTSEVLSRTERRLLERKQKNRDQREQKEKSIGKQASREKSTGKQASREKSTGKQASSTTSPSEALAPRIDIVKIFRRWFNPKIPFNDIVVRSHHLNALAYRAPIWLILAFLLTNEDTSPLVIQGSIGPSMLPTIQFFGDLWLLDSGAWHRLLGIERTFQVGDIVLWKHPETGRVSCKRIVGLEGDSVLRYGQFVHLYEDRKDLAIVWPTDAGSRGLDIEGKCKWDDTNEKSDNQVAESRRMLVVPEGHIWLEGDAPPFSLDSRQVGPIPMEWVRGRVMSRVWPIWREDEISGDIFSCGVSRDRPVPFPSNDQYLGKRFNLYKVSKEPSPEI